MPYTLASRLPGGERDPRFKTKPQLAVELVRAAQQAGIRFRTVVADCCYGDNPGFTNALVAAKVPFVLALKPRKGTWAPAEQAPRQSRPPASWAGTARTGLAGGGASSGASVTGTPRLGGRRMRNSADAQLGGWGPERRLRLVVATTDPARLPGHSSWYLLTSLPRPAGRRAQQANLAEVVRLYGLRNWVEQGYQQVKGELGWADFQVRSDRAIRRHWTLVCCAFSFCWQTFLADHPAQPEPPDPQPASTATQGAADRSSRRNRPYAGHGRRHCAGCGPG